MSIEGYSIFADTWEPNAQLALEPKALLEMAL